MNYDCAKLWMQTGLEQKVGRLGLTNLTDEDGAFFSPLRHPLRRRLLYICILLEGRGTEHTIIPRFLQEPV